MAKLLRDYSSRESAKRVLEAEFEKCIGVVKESLEDYSSPDFRGDHNETEAIQRLNLHKAMTNGKHLLWLIERMIELRVADFAVKAWSEQASFTADLQRAFRDDAWRNIVPGLPAVVLRCTSKLANAVAAGTILATKQVLLAWLLTYCYDSYEMYLNLSICDLLALHCTDYVIGWLIELHFYNLMGIRNLVVAGMIYMLIVRAVCDFGFCFLKALI